MIGMIFDGGEGGGVVFLFILINRYIIVEWKSMWISHIRMSVL